MIKALLKKQFAELRAMYFRKKKDGKTRSGSSAVWLIILLVFLLVSLATAFFGISELFASEFFEIGLEWLYFSLIGMMALALGTIGSVFSTYATLFRSKDNEALLSMPIPPRMILTVRMITVYFMSLMFSSVAWIPAVIVYCIRGEATAASVVIGIVFTFVIALFVTVLSCILGWVVALISGRLKNKSIVTVLITVVLLGAYYYFYSQINIYLTKLVENSEKVGASIKTWVYPIYELGLGATGKIVPALIFTAITAALFAVCMFILSRTFIRIVTLNKGSGKTKNKIGASKASSVGKALVTKELRRFVTSPTYMLNAGLGLILMPALAIVALIKRNDIIDVLGIFKEGAPWLAVALPVVAAALLALIASMNIMTAPSVSLEGKSLWILRSLPVEPKTVLRAKERAHMVLNVIPAAVSAVLAGIAFGADVPTVIAMVFVIVAFVWLTATAGLALNLKHPLLDWANEAVPIKQSTAALIVIFGGWAIAFAMGGAGFMLTKFIPAWAYLAAAGLVITLVSWLIRRWIDTKGVGIFAEL